MSHPHRPKRHVPHEVGTVVSTPSGLGEIKHVHVQQQNGAVQYDVLIMLTHGPWTRRFHHRQVIVVNLTNPEDVETYLAHSKENL